MNYVSVITSLCPLEASIVLLIEMQGLFAFVIGLWLLTKRKSFKGPKVDLQEMQRRRDQGFGLAASTSRPEGLTHRVSPPTEKIEA